MRNLLMKKNFVGPFTLEARREGATPKILFKFGAFHRFRGVNPLHSTELGNLISEAAVGRQQKSVHILILGVKGQQSQHFAGIGQPSLARPA